MSQGPFLVTGASGFIGGHLLRELEARGETVYCHSEFDGNIASCDLPYDGVRHVFHLAGKTFVPDSWKRPRDFYEVNTLGAANVLDFCRRAGASLTLLSSYVYGQPRRLPISEDHPVEAFNPYAHSKILAENLAAYYRDQFQLRVTVIRPFNIYGPGQAPWFLIPTLIAQALDPAKDRITVADIRPRRDFLFIRDLIALLMATVASPAGTVLNAGSGSSVSIGELVELINAIVPAPKTLATTGEARPVEVLDTIADVSRARRELGWGPRVTLSEGLRETIEAARDVG